MNIYIINLNKAIKEQGDNAPVRHQVKPSMPRLCGISNQVVGQSSPMEIPQNLSY